MADALQDDSVSLYSVLCDPAPPSSVRGETMSTKTKETVDNDVEMLVLEELIGAA